LEQTEQSMSTAPDGLATTPPSTQEASTAWQLK
jgi:hypothetical protein